MAKVKFTKENFDKLVKLNESAMKVAEVGYKASKSEIKDVAANLKELNNKLYDFRNDGFKYNLEYEE